MTADTLAPLTALNADECAELLSRYNYRKGQPNSLQLVMSAGLSPEIKRDIYIQELAATISTLTAQVAGLTEERDMWRKEWQQAEDREIKQEARADKAESALAAVTAERDDFSKRARTMAIGLADKYLEVEHLTKRATTAEQALADVRGRMTLSAIMDVLTADYPGDDPIACETARAKAILALMGE